MTAFDPYLPVASGSYRAANVPWMRVTNRANQGFG
jgi:hypothetical protein